MIAIRYTGTFSKDYFELLKEQPNLQEVIETAITRFQKNPADTRLVVHSLRRYMEGKWAIEITGDIRIIFKWIGKTTVRFLAIGSHEKVYKKQGKKE